jgi:hypothetical protein
MSGGSWNYFSYKLDEVIDKLALSPNPLRRAMIAKMRLLSEALSAIEWVDSGDYGKDDDKEAITRFLEYNGNEAIKAEIEATAKQAIADIEALSGLTGKTEVQITCNCPDESNFADQVASVILSQMRDSGLGDK